ncbi:MAG: alpha/beta hydrolase [Leptospiraceae bacterium]|nr:alpha/beta hydrolase [Leptospiraceae bacterium]
MKKKIFLGFFVTFLVFLISLPFTRYHLEEKVTPPSLPTSITELDSYLSESESKFGDVVQGAEKKIFWANGKQEQTEYSIVYIHGFSASRPEMLPLPDLVAKDLKANIFYTRLHGHARTPEAFSQTNANDWLNDTLEAFEIGKKIGKRVIIIGSSTGCTLAAWLASQDEYQKDIFSLVFISPNFYTASKMTKLFLYPAGVGFAKLIFGDIRKWEPLNEQMAKYWNHEYRWEALTPMIVLVEHVQNISFEKIHTPSLMLYTEQDKVIDTNEIIKKFESFGTKDKVLLNLKQIPDHVMAGDIRSPETTPLVHFEIMKFLKQMGAK